jgi:hypothetical protein
MPEAKQARDGQAVQDDDHHSSHLWVGAHAPASTSSVVVVILNGGPDTPPVGSGPWRARG